MHIQITKPALFAAACRFISTEGTRYYLNGVLLVPTGQIVATNGHQLFAAYDPDMTGITESIIVKPPKQKMPAGWFKDGTLTFDGEIVKHSEDQVGSATEIDATYPDWRRAVPLTGCTGTIAPDISYNFDYLADFKAVGKHLGVQHPSIMLNGLGPALIGFGTRTDCFGCLMPLRNVAPSVPEWV